MLAKKATSSFMIEDEVAFPTIVETLRVEDWAKIALKLADRDGFDRKQISRSGSAPSPKHYRAAAGWISKPLVIIDTTHLSWMESACRKPGNITSDNMIDELLDQKSAAKLLRLRTLERHRLNPSTNSSWRRQLCHKKRPPLRNIDATD